MRTEYMKCGCPAGWHEPTWPGLKAPPGMLEALISPEMRKAGEASKRRAARSRVTAMRRQQLAKHFAKRAAA